ncbi:MAG: hypothetical protein AAFY20_21815 [Cyanobacteria bacterium J06639_14]
MRSLRRLLSRVQGFNPKKSLSWLAIAPDAISLSVHKPGYMVGLATVSRFEADI